MKQSSASNELLFESYKFHIRITNQMTPIILQNQESKDANMFRNSFINSPYSLQVKYIFEMKAFILTFRRLYDTFSLFEEKSQTNLQKNFEKWSNLAIIYGKCMKVSQKCTNLRQEIQ